MVFVIARHKVADYVKWRQAFEGAVAMRKAGGEKSVRIFRTVDDPNNLVLFMEWDSLENCQKFMQSEDLQKDMQEAGVMEQPDINILNED